jgi:phage terminase large subunit
MKPRLSLPKDLINQDYLFLFSEPYRSIPLQIIYGGASSGKSVAIAQRDIFDIINEPRNFLIVRKIADTLRASVFEERKKVIQSWGLSKFFRISVSPMEITYLPTNHIMVFRGLDDVEKIKSIVVPNGVITDLRVEEATETKSSDIGELERRMRGLSTVLKRTVLSFNPTFRNHWIAKEHFNSRNIKFALNDEKLIFRTNYKSNRFLTNQDKRRIESYTGYQGQVYRDGLWGVLGDLIFNNWSISDISGINYDTTRYGIDFGFSSDPAAIIKTGYEKKKKELYIQNGIYIYGGTNDVLAAKAKPICGNNPVWCDSAEPKSISELRNQGENRISAYPVKKGKDSVWHSIQWLQQQNIIIDKGCTDVIDEFSQYQWAKNKNGETLTEPVGVNDHLIAALRYATERDRIGSSVNIAI